MMKKLVPLAVFIAGVGAWMAYQGMRSPVVDPVPTDASAQSGLVALLDARLPDPQGRSLGVRTWKEQVRVVNFWATSCPPCREEMPGFSRLQQRYADKGVQFVGIGIDDADKIIEFSKSNPVGYPLLIGQPEHLTLTATLGNPSQGLPFTLVIDRHDRLRYVRLGRLKERDLEKELDAVLTGG